MLLPKFRSCSERKTPSVSEGQKEGAPRWTGVLLHLPGSCGTVTHGDAGPRRLLAIPLLGALLATGALMAFMPRQAAADGPILGIDANPGDSGPDDLGSIDSCVSVSPGDHFAVDVTIQDVQDLLAW